MKAKRAKKEKPIRFTAGSDQRVLAIRGAERLAYGAAVEALRTTGVSVDLAAKEYAEAWRLTGGHVAEAARAYAERLAPPEELEPLPVAEAIELFIKAKAEDTELSEAYRQSVATLLRYFAQSFRTVTTGIEPIMISDWLVALRVPRRNGETKSPSEATRLNYRTVVSQFMRWCIGHKHLARGFDFAEIKTFTKRSHKVDCLHPDEMKRLLAAASPEVLPLVVLCGFAGVRGAEACRLDWSRIDFEHGAVVIEGRTPKPKRTRVIPMNDTTRHWLEPIRKLHGRVITKPLINKDLMAAAAKAGIKWRHNLLRHSFISYELAASENFAATASKAGNSEMVIREHYQQIRTRADVLVTKRLAARWFGIRRPKPADVIALPTSEAPAAPDVTPASSEHTQAREV